jgi:methyl-accepting chemotaxis protein
MTDKMVQITVEILDILATATKEMQQSAGSKSDLRLKFHEVDIVSEKFLKRVVGWTDLEDGIKKLDKLTNEEVAMANAHLLKITHNIDNNVTEVNEGVRRVDEHVLVVKSEVQLVSDNVKAVGDMVQTIADGGQRLSGESPTSSLILIIQIARQPPRK